MTASGPVDFSVPAAGIEASMLPKLNLADFQNSVPFLRELGVSNTTADDLREVELHIQSVPSFFKPKTWRFDAITAGRRYSIADLDLSLDGALLSRLTEAETATVRFVLCRPAEATVPIATLDTTVELLPRNQWGGLVTLPEMIAAFVQPNDPAIERLLKQTAEVLRKHGKISALNGYEGGPKRTWEQVSALWNAVAGMGLDYALPPASFEYSGQKVRSATQISDSGLATCLDLALLFCSAAEQLGFNPVLVFTKGHAFAGVWLRPEEFSTVVVDDVTALRKRVKLQELMLFETTLVTQHPAPSFAFAVEDGARQIAEERDETFELAVDIRRARIQRIKPLASAETLVARQTAEVKSTAEPVFADAPDLADEASIAEPDPATLSPKDRLDRWQRKLLDLSLRNNLLNFRNTKKSLKLEAPDPSALEDTLSIGEPLKIRPRPDFMDGADPRSRDLFESREHEDARLNHARDALKRREVFVAVQGSELEARLVELYRSARNTLQEGGANTLFLALGFLCWTRDDKPDQRYRAPLILLPVTLNRKSVRSGFSLTLHDDEPRFNPTLIEMLRQDFKLALGVTEGELPKDDAGLDVAKIWKSVSHSVKDIKGWEVSEDVVLAMFSFAKYLMWKDLKDRTEQLRENSVVRHLIDTPRESYPSGVAFPNPSTLDREYSPEQTFCPLPADSSQLSAVMAAARGKDFVLIGPPGTGKSQTIANLIAQCLAERKRVLFVSEKIAALDVVYRRLRDIGLGEFCLELHSSKARKIDVLQQLEKAWGARGSIDAALWRAEAQRLKSLRDDLNAYVERLHVRHRNGLTIFRAIGTVISGQDIPRIDLSWPTPDAHDLPTLQAMRDAVESLDVNLKAVAPEGLREHPLSPIEHSDWSPRWQQGVTTVAAAVAQTTQLIKQLHDQYCSAAGVPHAPLTKRHREALAVLIRILPYAAGRDRRFALRGDAVALAKRLKVGLELLAKHREITSKLSTPWSQATVDECKRGLDLLVRRQKLRSSLGKPWPADVLQQLHKGITAFGEIRKSVEGLSVKYRKQVGEVDAQRLLREWTKAERAFWPASWLGKRKIAKVMDGLVAGEGEPDVGQDLRRLARVCELREEIAALDISAATEGVWAGLKSAPDVLQAVLRIQKALIAATNEQPWEDKGLEFVADGRCGERLQAELARLRQIRRSDEQVAGLANLSSATGGLWNGLATNLERLRAAVEFQSAFASIQKCGALTGTHEIVARGECGAPMANDLELLLQRADVETQLAAYEDLKGITAGIWNGLETRADRVERAVKFVSHLSMVVPHLAPDPGHVPAVTAAIGRLFGERNGILSPMGRLAEIGTKYLTALDALKSRVAALIAHGEFSDSFKVEAGECDLDTLARRCSAITDAGNRLQSWCAWRKVRAQALQFGLAPLIAVIEQDVVKPGSAARTFGVNYSRWWLNAVVEQEPIARGFVSAAHEKRINDFRTLDDRFTELTRDWIRAGLCGELPSQDDITRNSEWGVLRHEMSKKKRHLPLRELLGRIPTALTKLTPCLLMSPLSIAQYLAPGATFDVVVFDEASQIPVWDAVGAIARGKQVVMVGDPKQLPPTSFFDRAESDLDDEDVEGDLESILDECLGANLPTLNLSWHYRSRHESLIAFSNHKYYRGGLVTFPSPVTEDKAVSFRLVDGQYEKGGARINKPEARALVADLVGRLRSPEFRDLNLTIGVVTFNTEQQALIEDLLDEERRNDPSIEEYFAEGVLEPVFVKNLESVQGDERDIVYFSTTYGPDLTGAVSMNFGPMNRSGGERRLNVAITRARQELIVFSSLKPEQMDLARTQAAGVRDLKHFLEFAQRGQRALAEATSGSQGNYESPFEEAVAAALVRKGWQLHTQVGASAFRIDLAVVHPDAPGVYLAGIECDGATYHRSATARDRDKLRERVLRGLGWQIIRVWSTDWWIDPAGTLDRLDDALKNLLKICTINSRYR